MAKHTNVTQLLLWSDDELPEVQESSQEEEEDSTSDEYISQSKLSTAVQWFLPGFELEDG